MSIRVAINGYGRIGRNILRSHYEGGKKHGMFRAEFLDQSPHFQPLKGVQPAGGFVENQQLRGSQ